ncbi:ABC transporter ATP-binding protein [Thalassobacillus pellis]|uniref:ABC transporter ATP-binding protein n=1 Tax=Thalassobacillus pellis TaxID=748008 RepID=UPI0019621BD7|nr:ATP-binding cassette domain-containing protein [Thalassobacillus pellis]MBM7553194.1 energy-coupling factor transport system ATP-binding protein [Thalassobacillus pellis]
MNIASVTNMRLKFPGKESLLFSDFSLSIKEGEKVLILGPSGCGKSTLLQVLSGLIPKTVDVPMKADEITVPHSWGYLFQDPDAQFCMPYVDEEIAFVLENLEVPREKMPDCITSYLRQVGLAFENNHTKISTLSGGMKQRLALASVLALEPEVIFLDEPTAMLDPDGTTQVWDTIKQIGDDKTLIIIEHKIDQIVDVVDRIILLGKNGNIIAEGPKQVIFEGYKQKLKEAGIWYPGVWDDYLEENQPDRTIEPVNNQPPAITLSDFSGYRGKKEIVHIDYAEARLGEWITVIGENGAGKSTLLLALMNLVQSAGTYDINGRDHKKVTNFAEEMAFVFQNPEYQFVTNSVYDEVAFTLRLEKREEAEISSRVSDSLHFYQLEEEQDNHPYQLSIGQKRRLSVAASLIKDQPILLLDEPTFGQDAKNTFAILEQLEQVRKRGAAILMVTHDTKVVEHFATRVWQLEDGKLIKNVPASEYPQEPVHA